MTRVEFSTNTYEFSHGRKPRGFGGWAFGVGTANPSPNRWDGEMLTSPPMLFAHAKLWAKTRVVDDYAGSHGTVTLHVLP